ncbi:lycopene cyclase domain-containing protein [Caldiplasma sukawensis]
MFPAYLIIDIFVFAGPFFLSIISKMNYIQKYRVIILSILPVAIPYIIWDMLVTNRDWYFNEKYVLNIRIVDLPIEEVLFFFVVPFAMFFVLEYLSRYIKEKTYENKWFFYVNLIAAILVIPAIFFSINEQYLFLDLIALEILLLSQILMKQKAFRSNLFWYFSLFGFIAFLIVNYLLTSLPVVEYHIHTILTIGSWNGRITTIPMEDFIYNFSLLSFYYIFYRYFSIKIN